MGSRSIGDTSGSLSDPRIRSISSRGVPLLQPGKGRLATGEDSRPSFAAKPSSRFRRPGFVISEPLVYHALHNLYAPADECHSIRGWANPA